MKLCRKENKIRAAGRKGMRKRTKGGGVQVLLPAVCLRVKQRIALTVIRPLGEKLLRASHFTSKAHLPSEHTTRMTVCPHFTDQDTGGSEKLENLLKFAWLVRGGARVLNPGVYKTKYSKEHSASKQLEICQVERT